jgi:hypothetical protein
MDTYNVSAGTSVGRLNHKGEVPNRRREEDRGRKHVGHVLWHTRVRSRLDRENGANESAEPVTELSDSHNGSDTEGGGSRHSGYGSDRAYQETRKGHGLYRLRIGNHEDCSRSVQNLRESYQDKFGANHRRRCCQEPRYHRKE